MIIDRATQKCRPCIRQLKKHVSYKINELEPLIYTEKYENFARGKWNDHFSGFSLSRSRSFVSHSLGFSRHSTVFVCLFVCLSVCCHVACLEVHSHLTQLCAPSQAAEVISDHVISHVRAHVSRNRACALTPSLPLDRPLSPSCSCLNSWSSPACAPNHPT